MLKLLRNIVAWKFTRGLILLVPLVWQAYTIFAPKESDVDLLRHTVAQAVAQQVVGQMRREKPVRQLAVADLMGDRTGYVKRILTEELRKSDKFAVVPDTFVQRIIKEALTVAKGSGLVSRRLVEDLEGEGISSLEAAIELANRMGIDMVLFGEVKEFSAEAGRARVETHLRLADARAHQAVFGGVFVQAVASNILSPSYLRARIEATPLGLRLFTWVVFTTLFPVVLSYVLVRGFRQESSVVNLLILVGLTLLDTLLAFTLMGLDAASFPEQVLLMLAFIGSLAYNYMACSQLEQRHR